MSAQTLAAESHSGNRYAHLSQPDRVIAELAGVLLAAGDTECDGYVPDAMYTCGGLLHAGTLWLRCGASDARIGFASITLTDLIDAMDQSARREPAEDEDR